MIIKECIHCGLKDRPVWKDAVGYFCPRCGKVPDKEEQPTLPDFHAKVKAAKEEEVTDPDYVPPPPPDVREEDMAEEEEPDVFEEPETMVKTVKKPAKKKAARPAKKTAPTEAASKKSGAASKPVKKKAAAESNGHSRGDFLRGIDEMLQRELELQKKKQYNKMSDEDSLNDELDAHAAEFEKPKHQGVKAYRSYFNGETKSMGTTRKASDPILVSKEQIDKWLEADKKPDVLIREKTKARNDRRG
jgi:hypothetical protein